jgi:TolA-binding protein
MAKVLKAKTVDLKARKTKLIIFICLIVIGAGFLVNTIRRGSAVSNYRYGAQLLKQGDYRGAIEKLQKAADYWPHGWWFHDANNKLLYCKLNSGENIDKLLLNKKGANKNILSTGGITLKILLGVILLGVPAVFILIKLRAQKKKKEEEYLSYIQNVGKKVRANMSPVSLEKTKNDFSSVEDYQEYIKYHKEGEFVKLAECLIAEYYLKESPDNVEYITKTVESYKILLKEYTNSIYGEEITYKLANFNFFRLHNYDEAIEAYKRIIEKYPDSKWIKIAEARMNLIRDNSDHERKPLTIYVMAERLYENKKYDKALDEFRKVVAKFPDSTLADDALYAIGDIYMYKMNKTNEPIKEYQRIIADYPKSRYAANAQYKIGECYRKNKQIAEAINSYKTFIENYPNADFADYAYYYLAQSYEQEKNLKEAKVLYEKLIANYPASMWVVVATSRLYVLKDIVKDNTNDSGQAGT